MQRKIILVDEEDNAIGLEDKMRAHSNGGRLHRAISVFVFNSNGETMLQQRADSKYHSRGLWSNTCCSHPFRGESVIDAAHRRLVEEMGFDCKLRESFSFIYKAKVGSGLTEYEFDHVLFGVYNKKPELDPREAKDWKWISIKKLKADAKRNGKNYSAWLKILLKGKLDKEADKFLTAYN